MASKDQNITKLISFKLPDGDGMDLAETVNRKLSYYEEEILNYLAKNSYSVKSPISNDNLGSFPLTENFNIIIKHVSLKIEPGEDTERIASSCQSKVIGKILENLAIPYAVTNSFDLNCSKSRVARNLLSALIKGTSKILNTTGIPNLNTSISVNNPIPLINCTAMGIQRKSEQNIKDKVKSFKIFFLGKLSDFESTNDNQKTISAYHLKFIKDALIEQINNNNAISTQYMANQNMIASIANLAFNNEYGVNIDLSKLFKATNKKNNYDCLLSDKPNSFIVAVSKVGNLIETARKWELDCIEIGESTSEDYLKIKNNDEIITDLPIDKIKVKLLERKEEEYYKKNEKIKSQYINKIPLPKTLRDVAWFLLRHPNIASTNCLHSLFDSMAGISNLNTNFRSDANLIKIKKTDKAVAICTSSTVINGIDPAKRIQIEISTILRSLVCSGAKINSMSISIKIPENAIDNEIINEINVGASIASKKFNYPFEINLNVSKEVNKDNSKKEYAYISLVASGLIENCNHQMTMSFKDKGNVIFLLGQSKDSLASSEYLTSYVKNEVAELPDYSSELERKMQLTLLELIKLKLISSAHNVSKGGLFISLLESAMVFGLGFDIITDTDQRTDSFLFGELPGRVIVSVTPNKETRFIDHMINKEIPFLAIGHVTKGEMRIDDISYGFIDDAKEEYYSAFNKFLNKM